MTLQRTSGLARISPQRLAELAEQGIKRPFTTFRPRTDWRRLDRKPASASSAKPLDNPDPATVDLVLERDNYSCAMCGFGVSGVRGVDWSIHHRLRRSQGGDHSPAVLVTLCGNGTQGHHGLVHARITWAQGHGWLLKSGQDPLVMPMDHVAYGGPVLLTADGRAVRTAERGAA